MLDPGIGRMLLGALALLFAHAAWHKWRALAHFGAQLAAYRLLPAWLLGMATLGIPLVEAGIALALLAPATRAAAAASGAALLLGYAVAMGINLGRGRRDLDCGCAGPAERRPIAAWMVWRNILLGAVLLAVSQPWAARTLGPTDWLTIGGGLSVLVLLYAALERLLGQVLPRSAVLRGTA
ncbi:MAG: methylamine utilization protein MauE [Gammaproteobacteria bacterium]|nr:methylamine utilization protein MauE [Gammaproteobacteria bacterium]